MNRIQQLPQKLQSAGSLVDVAAAVAVTEKRNHPCAVFAPLHYETNYAYPLLIWLHGPGADERHLKHIMPHISMRNYVAVAPRGTLHRSREDARQRYSWRQHAGQIAEAEQRVFDCIEAAQERFNIARHRIFLAGFDCGGTMSFRLAMDHPQRFAGALSLGGPFPKGRNPLANLPHIRKVPLFLAYGRESQACPAEEVCGNEISSRMLSDMDRWMMEQVCPGPSNAG
jgi:phospholipase/carboxylesterase